MQSIKNIAIFGIRQNRANDNIMVLINHLRDLGCTLYIDSSLGEISGVDTQGNLATWCNILDLIIVFGGDGTFLSSAKIVVDSNYDIPVIGVNHGRLGFLTDIAANDILQTIIDVVSNNSYTLETRHFFDVQVLDVHNEIILNSIALNDVVISRGAVGSMIEFTISVDNEFVLSQKADGVIFATPTGSTAYSLASGGPIVHPQSRVFSIVPICPQSLSNRPFVVDDGVNIACEINTHNPTIIYLDGKEHTDLAIGSKVLLAKHKKHFTIMHPSGYNYYQTLRQKLSWSFRPS